MFFNLLRINILICFLICCNIVFAQEESKWEKIQRITKEAEKASYQEKSEIYYNLCCLCFNSTDSALYYVNKAIYYATKSKQNELLFNSKMASGKLYLRNSDFSNAIDAYSSAEKLLKDNYNPEIIYNLYFNLGFIFYNTKKQYDLALDYYFKALDYAKILNEAINFINVYNNIGNVYIEKEEYDNALKYYNLSMEEAKKEDNYYDMASLYNSLGCLYQRKKDYEIALKNYHEAFIIFEKNKLPSGMAIMLNNIAELKMELQDYIAAEKYIIKADSIYKIYNYRESRQNFYHTAYNVYYNLKNYEKAFYYIDRYYLLKDSLYTEKLDDKINQLTTEYKVDKLKTEAEQKDYKIHKQRQLNTILYIIIITVLIFIIFLAIMIKQKVRLNKKLNSLNQKLTQAYKDINDNLNYARRIQLACMQSQDTLPDNLFVLDQPKSIVGGDFYLIKQQNKRTYIVLGDCTGHGSSGGFLSVLSIQYLNLAFEQMSNLTDILRFLNNNFHKYISNNQFLKNESLCINIVCIEDNIVKYAGSRHRLWKYNSSENQIYEYKTDKENIGTNDNFDFSLKQIEVEKNDMVYLSSDGFPDQFGGKNKEKLKYNRFRDSLSKSSVCNTVEDSKNFLYSELNNWKINEEQTDDILVIGIKF